MGESKKCIYCGKKIRDGDRMCGNCGFRYESVHKLYLTCQLVRKHFGMKYDEALDDERWKYQG